jgi:RNA polymerase sigma-70 factor (ECF subfamily)
MINSNTGSDPEDNDLLARIAARDQSALSDLYDRHGRLLYNVVLAVVRDTDDAEEILQALFLRIWKEADSLRADAGTPKTWMLRMAHNAAIELLRARRQQRREPDSATTNDGEANDQPVRSSPAGEPSVNDDITVPLASALAALPLDERSVIDMAFLQGYSHSEIAEMIGVPPGTVQSRIRTGMITLRSRLGSDSRSIGMGQSK